MARIRKKDQAISIREATEGDLDSLWELFAQVQDLHAEALPHVFKKLDEPGPSRDLIFRAPYGEDAILLVAEGEGGILGMLRAEVRQSPDYLISVHRRWVDVEELAVKEGYRGRGIGKLLMEAAHSWAESKGIDMVELNVWEFNHDAIRFYERLGYTTSRRKMWKRLR